MNNPLVSICMAYKDRKKELAFTLDTIIQSSYKNIELVIVDDGSEKNIDSLVSSYGVNYKLITIKKEDRWWINPCVPFNMAINNSIGDLVILQNPECCHIGDVIQYCVDHAIDNQYLCFCCYVLERVTSKRLRRNGIEYFKKIDKLNEPGFKNGEGWYQHPIHRSVKYHFLSCITRNDLKKIGGFNQMFALGAGYDDDEFVFRIEKNGINIVEVSDSNPVSVHQWHHRPDYRKMDALFERNKLIFERIKGDVK